MLLQFAVGGAVIPFLTILLRDRGLDFSQISRIFLVSSATLLVCPVLWGMVADRYLPLNRLFSVLNGMAAAALFGLAGQTSFIGLMVAVAAFYACFHPTLTLINTLCFHHLEDPQAQFARLRAWGSAGWIVPSLPVSVWIACGLSGNFDFVIVLGIGFSLAMALAALMLPHTPAGAAPVAPGGIPLIGYWPATRRLLGNSNYLTIIGAFFLMSASFSLMIFYSPPFLEDRGVSREWIGPIQSIGVVLEIVMFPFLPRYVQRRGYVSAVLIGCACLLLRHLVYVYSDNAWVLSASYLLAGMVIVFFHIGCSILANAIAGREVKATAQTLLVLFGSGLGPMFANGAAGPLSKHFENDLRPVFAMAAVLAAMAFGLVWVRRKALARATGHAVE